MKVKILLIFIFAGLINSGYAQTNSNWDAWNWLLGSWVGEGSGTPGQGSGEFSFNFDLNKNILVRKSHSEYPAVGDKPAIIHDDLLIIYPKNSDNSFNAIYFDNESHVINYLVTVSENNIVFTSEKIISNPVFRLTYSLPANEVVNTKFEMSMDGLTFMTYIQGNSVKKK
jgi:hypothetical protein